MDISNATDEEIMNAMDSSVFTGEVETPSEESTETVEEALSESTEEATTEDESEESTETEEPAEEVETEVTNETSDEAAAQLAKLFTPFQANGKEVKVDNIDDAIRLMQMGVGFNKKMAGLKPHLKLLKILENHDLLSEEKISFLVDLNKKDPTAIGKLLADSNIDPLNLDSGNEYTPKAYTVSDSELELDDVLRDLKDSPHYAQTLDVAVNKWDSTSKQLLISNPSIIRILHDQIGNGIYAKVTQVIEKERLLGRLNGLSDLEAYKQVGDEMNAKGLFAQPATKPPATAIIPNKANANESALKSRKLAASPTKSSPGKKMDMSNFNPLAATDEEIKNMTLDKFL